MRERERERERERVSERVRERERERERGREITLRIYSPRDTEMLQYNTTVHSVATVYVVVTSIIPLPHRYTTKARVCGTYVFFLPSIHSVADG